MSYQDEDEIELNSDEEEERDVEAKEIKNNNVDVAATAESSDNENALTKETNYHDEEGTGTIPSTSTSTTAAEISAEIANDSTKQSKKSKLQSRLRNLQLKINQSKKLNHNEVLQEGERLSSKEAYNKHTKQVYKNDVKRKEQEQWDNIHEKNVSTLLQNGDTSATTRSTASLKSKKEVQALIQSGSESLRQSHRKLEKQERNLYSTNDYYNPEGQFRNYERSLKSIHSNKSNNSSIDDETRERNGAKRLANEMKRRMAKSEKRKQNEMDFEATDVTYIDKRNKHFNEKINRNYDKHTAEIRQNLERGTAL